MSPFFQKETLKRENKIHFTSLGCPRNLVDTEVMLGILLHAGYEVTDQLEEANYLIVNTCGFLAAAREEACETLTDLFHEKNPTAKIIATGCMVQQHSPELKEKFPNIHYLLGSGNPDAIIKAIESETPGEVVTSSKSFLEMGEVPRKTSTPKHYAYLKIAEGCRKQCSYCIIPSIKGPLKSKPTQQIVKEFKSLLSQGVREIILIAQDLGDYGKDFHKKDELTNLLKTLLESEGDYWIRLLYLYPDEITNEMMRLMKSDHRICNYLDMPIQHINDTLLKAMYRKTNKAQITSTIKKLRKEIPDIVIRTSLIVGFPGETEAHFQELCEFLTDYPLDQVGIFQYSQEEGSQAAKLPNQIAPHIKEKRYHALMKIQQKNVEKQSQKMVGRQLRVLIDGYHPETDMLMVGRYFGQCPDVDNTILLNQTDPVDRFGQMYTVEVTDAAGYDLVGSVLCKDETQTMQLALTT